MISSYSTHFVHLCYGVGTGAGTPTSILGPSSPFQAGSSTYLADVVDQLGDSIVARCWWDTEPWAAMRQELVAAAGQPTAVLPPTFNVSGTHSPSPQLQVLTLRHHVSLPAGCQTQSCLHTLHRTCVSEPNGSSAAVQRVTAQAATVEDGVRWARVLAELAHGAAALCPASCRRACEYIGSRLQVQVGRYMTRHTG